MNRHAVMKVFALALGLAACSSSGPAAPAAPAVPIARTRADLVQHEGMPVRVEGRFRFPTEVAFARNTLLLDDGTVVVLPRPSTGIGAAELVEANNGARLAVRGLVYLDVIPEKYKIIGRTRDPYLVELAAVERIE